MGRHGRFENCESAHDFQIESNRNGKLHMSFTGPYVQPKFCTSEDFPTLFLNVPTDYFLRGVGGGVIAPLPPSHSAT